MSLLSNKVKKSIKSPKRAEISINKNMRITRTGRVWVDPNEVVKTSEFNRQIKAVKKIFEGQKATASPSK